MTDVVNKATRSRMMSGIKYKNTKPELLIRSGLFSSGYRYRLHDKSLPGTPDIVFKKYNAVVFVHGCFWHLHECKLFKWPKTRKEFWQNKLHKNQIRDARHLNQLKIAGWRTALIWECAIKNVSNEKRFQVIANLGNWLHTNSEYLSIPDDLENLTNDI